MYPPPGGGGGHSNGKRGYQARPWTHKKHPNQVLFRYEKKTLNMRFCMHFSSFACHVLSKICPYDQKHTLFSNFARFCTPKRCTRVQCLVLKNNPNYVNFWTSLIPPLTFECPPEPPCQNIPNVCVFYFLLCIFSIII